MKVPVRVDEIITQKCEALGEKGDGIFRIDGFVVIVPNTEVSKTYEIKVTKVFRSVAFGEKLKEVE